MIRVVRKIPAFPLPWYYSTVHGLTVTAVLDSSSGYCSCVFPKVIPQYFTFPTPVKNCIAAFFSPALALHCLYSADDISCYPELFTLPQVVMFSDWMLKNCRQQSDMTPSTAPNLPMLPSAFCCWQCSYLTDRHGSESSHKINNNCLVYGSYPSGCVEYRTAITFMHWYVYGCSRSSLDKFLGLVHTLY